MSIEILDKVKNLGLTVEIIGDWTWVSGDTRPHSSILKTLGFWYAPKKKMWYSKPEGQKRYISKGVAIETIRNKYGSVKV